MNWGVWAERIIYINFAWYVLLAIAFACAANTGKSIYFFGAAILTIGVMVMK